MDKTRPSSDDATHFGFQTVPAAEKTRKVAAVFDSVADKYDLMNDLMSFGVHRLWKRYALALCGVRRGQRVLDLAGGTGDIAARLAPRAGPSGRVVLADINAAMLARGRCRLVDRGITGNVAYVQADAEHLPFPDASFDCLTMAFGLRNVTDKAAALRAMFRVLKPGGRALVLEFSRVAKPLEKAYDLYSFKVLPWLGKRVANDEASYRYLAESIRMHPDQETLAGMMREAGLGRVEYFNMSAGVVALHRGFKL